MSPSSDLIIILLTQTFSLVKALTSVPLSSFEELVKAVSLTKMSVLYGPKRNDRIAPSEFQPLWLAEAC